jgi:perosamine synthetase
MKIPVYQPSLRGNEKKYVNECLDSTWISSKGKFVEQFEAAFAAYTGAKHATSVSNGTVAVHLCCLALGLGAGDEVIVPTFTYIASVNPIKYVGATPVFVDSLRESWQMDPEDVRRKITSKTKAIMAVHLYGCPCDMTAIMQIAKEHRLYVIEDCAEATGSKINGQHVGTFGDISAFSFFGNKTITTGEGGMVVTSNPELFDLVHRIKGQGLAKDRTYWHDIVGYNFRMTNICAAIGVAQLERVQETIEEKIKLARRYDALLKNLPVETHKAPSDVYLHTYWMYSILLPEGERDRAMAHLAAQGIETRPLFFPVHTMPVYKEHNFEMHPVAHEIAYRGINLPSWPELKEDQVKTIVDCLSEVLVNGLKNS